MMGSRADKRAAAGTRIGVMACSLRALLLLLLLLLGSRSSYSQNKYDLNDPRNPDCPCHQYQKMADEAYKQLQNGDQSKQFVQNAVQESSNNNKGTSRNTQQLTIDNNSAPRKASTSSGSNGAKNKKKKPGTSIRKKINRSRLKYSRIKKQRPDYSVCYKW
jgi:hypothetical protein